MADADLRKIIRAHLPSWHWLSIETGLTEPGVPDMNGCKKGLEVWVENKRTLAWAVGLDVAQVGWHLRRTAEGGRTFVAVRRLRRIDERGGEADELWLYSGRHARELREKGLRAEVPWLCRFSGGPSSWCWGEVDSELRE